MATGDSSTYYDRAIIHSCKINGEDVILEYLTSDSQTTIKEDNVIPPLVVCLLFSIGFFIAAIKTKK